MGLLDQHGGVAAPGEVLRQVYSQVSVAGDHFHICILDVQGAGRTTGSLEVHHHLFCLLDINAEVVVSAPTSAEMQKNGGKCGKNNHFSKVCCTVGEKWDNFKAKTVNNIESEEGCLYIGILGNNEKKQLATQRTANGLK